MSFFLPLHLYTFLTWITGFGLSQRFSCCFVLLFMFELLFVELTLYVWSLHLGPLSMCSRLTQLTLATKNNIVSQCSLKPFRKYYI